MSINQSYERVAQQSTRQSMQQPDPHRGTAARRNTHRAWNTAAILVIWGTSLAVLALWVLGGGVQSVRGLTPETLNSLSRLAGLVSANLLMYQVLLMARIPMFEKGFGRGGIVRAHRFVGMWSVTLLAAHFVLIVFGYAWQAGIDPLAQLADIVWNYPAVLLSVVGTLLVLMVAATSARRARRKLRYEGWHLLHLYGYLGIALAVPHMLWTGADFVANPVATVYWWGLWAVTFAAVIVFRIAAPLARSLRTGLRVTGVRPDGVGGVAVAMRGRKLDRLGAEAGQFFVWRFLDGPGWSRGHPFSLARSPQSGEMQLAARIVGDGTARLASLQPGTRVLIEGPYGTFAASRRTQPGLLMIGAGSGVVPLVAMLEAEPWAPGQAVLITRDRDAAHRMRAAEIAWLVAERGLVHIALDGPRNAWPGSWMSANVAGDGVSLLQHLAPQGIGSDAFVCGPAPWMDAVMRDLKAAGVPRDRIHHEQFSTEHKIAGHENSGHKNGASS